MYNTWIPIHGRTLNYGTRDVYLAQLREAECTHIVIVAYEMEREGAYEALADHIAYFRAHGVEAGIWIGTTIGHGVLLSHDVKEEETRYTPLKNLDGRVISGTSCPLDPDFRRDFSAYVARLAATGAKTILLDDDFRLSRRAGGVLTCVCDRHMAEIARLTGEDLSREEFCARAFTGPANKYRDAFLTAAGNSLRLLASDIRAAVDAVDPTVRVALCSVHSHWDVDGADGLELTKILAGKNPPLLRLHGAPYWAVTSSDKDLTAVFEIARMFASFCENGGAELISEGDVYPRPRYNVPASYLELFDAVLRADGLHSGILKYTVDYCATPEFETGYLAHHRYDLPLLKAVTEAFEGTEPLGVRVHIAPHRIRSADLDLDPVSDQSPSPSAGAMLQAAGVPTVYTGRGVTDAVFGEEGRYRSPAEFEHGMLIDASAAVLLTRRGFDVGLTDLGSYEKVTVSALVTDGPAEHATVMNGGARLRSVTLKHGAEVLLSALVGGVRRPLLYRYENAEGQRFLVALFSGFSLHRSSGICRSYLFGRALRGGLEWLTAHPLPVLLPTAPSLYTVLAGDGDRRALLLANLSPDAVLPGSVTFDRPVRSVRARSADGPVECAAEGCTVRFERPIPAFSAVLIEARTAE